MKKICVVGSGYVGLVLGACLADFGINVVCVDNNERKIEELKKGIIPIYEPGLEKLIERNTYYKRLEFTTDIESAIKASEVIFIAVGTPPREDGSADLKHVLDVADSIGKYMNDYKVIVDKSTVPVGTGQLVKEQVKKQLKARNIEIEYDIVSNPEFLREGSAIHDFTHPDRIVIGAETERSMSIMKEVYRVLYLNETPFVATNVETAELIKYASNAFLAMKITYINEIANLCESVDANVQHVAKALGMDGRISSKFLHSGPGYGGSCFPKDTRALCEIAKKAGERISLIETTVEANETQKMRMVRKIEDEMCSLEGLELAILGITFKPNTDDMREAPALVILPELVKRGATLRVYDPKGKDEGMWRLGDIEDKIAFHDNEYDAINKADAVVILTEWNQFRYLDLERISISMKGNRFFDLRNIYNKSEVEQYNLKYFGVGR